ncbi:hypothetical protein [Streptomyces sp. NPDC051000]|uniref:hypothetical protein n=1 Tax=Streptomyces sp. NPDC051000 TaxID=3155520 RepID=UPI0033D28BF9
MPAEPDTAHMVIRVRGVRATYTTHVLLAARADWTPSAWPPSTTYKMVAAVAAELAATAPARG